MLSCIIHPTPTDFDDHGTDRDLLQVQLTNPRARHRLQGPIAKERISQSFSVIPLEAKAAVPKLCWNL